MKFVFTSYDKSQLNIEIPTDLYVLFFWWHVYYLHWLCRIREGLCVAYQNNDQHLFLFLNYYLQLRSYSKFTQWKVLIVVRLVREILHYFAVLYEKAWDNWQIMSLTHNKWVGVIAYAKLGTYKDKPPDQDPNEMHEAMRETLKWDYKTGARGTAEHRGWTNLGRCLVFKNLPEVIQTPCEC